MADIVLDTKGMKCPLPIVQIAKAVKTMSSGQTLEVVADDPAFYEDVKAWCTITENILVKIDPAGDVNTATIRLK